MDWIRERQGGRISPRTYVLVGFLLVTLYGVHSLDQQQKAARERARMAAAAARVPAAAVLAVRDPNALSGAIPSGWGRDPFTRAAQDRGDDEAIGRTPRGREPSRGTGLYLQGIMVGPRGRTALINGDVCREGERVGGYEVLSIGTRTVMLIQGGNVTTLTLRGDGS